MCILWEAPLAASEAWERERDQAQRAQNLYSLNCYIIGSLDWLNILLACKEECIALRIYCCFL